MKKKENKMEKYISKEAGTNTINRKISQRYESRKYIGLVNFRINELATTDVIPVPKKATN